MQTLLVHHKTLLDILEFTCIIVYIYKKYTYKKSFFDYYEVKGLIRLGMIKSNCSIKYKIIDILMLFSFRIFMQTLCPTLRHYRQMTLENVNICTCICSDTNGLFCNT